VMCMWTVGFGDANCLVVMMMFLDASLQSPLMMRSGKVAGSGEMVWNHVMYTRLPYLTCNGLTP
jgi:hypothetical protein